MWKTYLFILSLLLLSIQLSGYAVKPAASSGTIHFMDGGEAVFTETGMKTSTLIYKLEGKLDDKDVTYYFSDLSQIYFIESDKGYYSSKSNDNTGKVSIVDRTGETFFLHDAYIAAGFLQAAEINYRFFDPVTKENQWKSSEILNNISHITFD